MVAKSIGVMVQTLGDGLGITSFTTIQNEKLLLGSGVL